MLSTLIPDPSPASGRREFKFYFERLGYRFSKNPKLRRALALKHGDHCKIIRSRHKISNYPSMTSSSTRQAA